MRLRWPAVFRKRCSRRRRPYRIIDVSSVRNTGGSDDLLKRHHSRLQSIQGGVKHLVLLLRADDLPDVANGFRASLDVDTQGARSM